MFTGRAEEAMNLYVSLFPDGAITSLQRNEGGQVQVATFTLAGQELTCIDSPPVHAFTFTPSMSLSVQCDDEAQLDRLFAELSKDGQVLMEPADYGFSAKYAWISDRFGVSWQLNLPRT